MGWGTAGATAPSLSPMVGVLGDSLLIMNDVDGVMRADGPLAVATWLSGGKIRYAYLGGWAGQSSAQILARVNDFVATGAKTIAILCGANDGGGTGFPSTTRPNLDAIIAGVIARGGTPVLVTAPPRGTAGSPPSSQVKLSINAYNHYVRNRAQQLGVPLVEWYTIFADVAGSNDYYAAGMTYDGIHPSSAAGQLAAGQAIATALLPLLPPATPPFITSNVDAANLSQNGLFLVSSAGKATGWSVSSTSGTTPSIVTKTVGNAQRFDLTSNTSAFLMNHSAPAFLAVIPGNRYRATANLSWSGGCIPRMQIDTGTGSGITAYAVWKPMFTSIIVEATDCPVVFDFTPPAGVTQVAYEFTLLGSGLTGFCEISRVGLVDLTAQGIAS